jgi:hypothetical protein
MSPKCKERNDILWPNMDVGDRLICELPVKDRINAHPLGTNLQMTPVCSLFSKISRDVRSDDGVGGSVGRVFGHVIYIDGQGSKSRGKLRELGLQKTSSLQNANCSNRTRDIDAMALVQTNPDAYVIKPEAAAPAIDTSDWPLLLKNYSDCTKLSL